MSFSVNRESRLEMMEPLARAYARSVPEQPADGGLFGPRSLVWRVHRDRSFPLAGMRSLMVQALHPLAMAGVDQHSGWRQDPVGRLAATSAYLATITFGERAAAEQAAARVRRIHDHVRGVDAVTGRPYAASDPALLLWIHGALVESGIAAAQLFGTPLSAEDSDRYVAEMVTAAELTHAVHAHPTLPEAIAEAALDVDGRAVHIAPRKPKAVQPTP